MKTVQMTWTETCTYSAFVNVADEFDPECPPDEADLDNSLAEVGTGWVCEFDRVVDRITPADYDPTADTLPIYK